MVKDSKETIIVCPHCKKNIPLNEAVTHKIEADLKAKFESETALKEKEFAKREKDLLAQEKEISKTKESLDTEIERRLKLEREKIAKEIKSKVHAETSMEISSFKEEIESKNKKIQEFKKHEIDLRREKADLESRAQSMDLEVVRKVDAEKVKIREEVTNKLSSEHLFKERESENLIKGLKDQIEILKKKAEQGSQQNQGEVLELELEEILKGTFPYDVIEPVPKGIKGADVIHKINNQLGQYSGSIIWETKRAKNWSDSWVDKLKEDQRELGADVAILLTTALPKNIKGFGMLDGIWVTDHASIVGLATSIRLNLVHVAQIKQSIVGQTEKMEAMYHYLSGSEFKQKVEAIVEAFVAMKKDLDAEKRAMEKIWSKREKQIDRVVKNTIRMYGDMQGIVGSDLPQIKILELPLIGDETSEEISEDTDVAV